MESKFTHPPSQGLLRLPSARLTEKTSVEEDSHLLPLSLHLATNGGYSRLCWGQAASAELICKDWHPDDDFAGVIYSWQDHILSYGRVQLDFDICCPADTSNSTSATPAWFILRPWEPSVTFVLMPSTLNVSHWAALAGKRTLNNPMQKQ